MNLLFVTAGFPYGSGETFIENEIDVIAKRFDRVFIVALTESNQAVREVKYSNIQVLKFYPKFSLTFKLRAVWSIFFWREIIHHGVSIHKLKTALVFYSFSHQIFCIILQLFYLPRALLLFMLRLAF